MAARFPTCTNVQRSSPNPAPHPSSFGSATVSALPAINYLPFTPLSSACNCHVHVNQNRRNRCKAVLLHEVPFAGAIGACVLNSLISPLPVGPNDDEDGDSTIDSADARFAVMGIISFIPYFNWMSWVFAWMDTGDKRYAAYAIVYLLPYLRSNLSLLPDESWLPIASILVGILHIQLEASIKNGDIPNFLLFNRKKEAKVSEQETGKDEQNLPSASDESRYKIRDWGMPKKNTRQVQHLDEDGEEGKRQ